MKEVTGRGVSMFRCHLDPMIGNKPRQAFVPSDMGATAELTNVGIYMRLSDGREHVVPFANVQSVRLEAETAEVVEMKRSPGRPKVV